MSKTANQKLDAKLLTGLKVLFEKSKTITFQGDTYTYKELHDLLAQSAGLAAATEKADEAASTALKAERAFEAGFKGVRAGLKKYVKTQLGESNPALVGFGIQPAKQRKSQNLDTKVEALQKREATRKARGTMGKVQKQKIKGVVNAAPQAPAPQPAPQPVAPPPAQPQVLSVTMTPTLNGAPNGAGH